MELGGISVNVMKSFSIVVVAGVENFCNVRQTYTGGMVIVSIIHPLLVAYHKRTCMVSVNDFVAARLMSNFNIQISS